MNRNSKRTTATPLGKVGSGNVFADLGLPNPDEELLKAKLVSKISDVIGKRELTQVQAGEVMGLPQSKSLNCATVAPKPIASNACTGFSRDWA